MKIDSKTIKELRKDNGLRLSDVAARLHVSEATISRYESGEIQRASPAIINAYSKLFRVPVTYICENLDSDWVEVLQKGRLADPRVAGFIEYLEEQAEREINDDIVLSMEERELVLAFRQADEKTHDIVRLALGLNKNE
jgi:transcriptional regulator with XRE-family HTH domain